MNESKQIIEEIQQFTTSYLIYTMCELGVFDYIYEEKYLNYIELAEKIKIDKNILWRLLRVLISMNYITVNDNILSLTKKGELLSKENKNSIKDTILMCGREGMRHWAMLYPALIKNKIPYELVIENNPFDVHSKDKDMYSVFNSSMNRSSSKLNIDNYLINIKSNEKIKIADVGGGSGAIIEKFLMACPNSEGVIMDLPHVKQTAEKYLKDRFLDDRCKFIACDFFDKINIDADIYILSRVLHDWDDDKSIEILKNIVKVMDENSKLIVLEKVLSDKLESDYYKSFLDDINVWIMCGGKERTYEEFTKLFNSVGLKINSVTKIENKKCIFELIKF